MTGDDVKKLSEDLDLSVIGFSQLIGVEPKTFHTLVGYRAFPFGPEVPVPALSMELLTELWRNSTQIDGFSDALEKRKRP